MTGEGDRLALLVVTQGLLVVAAALVICVIQRTTALQSAGFPAVSPAEPLTRT
ncbi:hypothetical protein [Streptomyces sp. NPDC001296]